MSEKNEITLEIWNKLIEMMKSSNPEDFFMGINIYLEHERTNVLDWFMIKSFSGQKRKKILEHFKAIVYKPSLVPTLKQLEYKYNFSEEENKIYKTL
tara:strand:- start:344 stop:634 length:291 start_codon:yes stop_codon:yes gene_type:complete